MTIFPKSGTLNVDTYRSKNLGLCYKWLSATILPQEEAYGKDNSG